MNSVLPKASTSALRLTGVALTILAMACSDQLVDPDSSQRGGGGIDVAARPPNTGPSSCPDGVDLRITLRDDAGDALRSDGKGSYEEGADGGVHISGNGELMFWIDDAPRHVEVSVTRNDGSPFDLTTTDRIYTVMGTHEDASGQPISCSLTGMADGSTGTAAFEVELDADGFVRYGRDCDGNRVDATRVATSRSGNTWTITGSSGLFCVSNGLKGKRAALVESGTAAGFSMTLEAL